MTKAVFDFASNHELSNFAVSKNPGDDVEIVIKGKFISADGGRLEIDMEELEFEYDDQEVEIEPDLEDPVALEVFEVSDMGEASSEAGDEELGDDIMLEDEPEEETN